MGPHNKAYVDYSIVTDSQSDYAMIVAEAVKTGVESGGGKATIFQ